jgi:hypothetical protein
LFRPLLLVLLHEVHNLVIKRSPSTQAWGVPGQRSLAASQNELLSEQLVDRPNGLARTIGPVRRAVIALLEFVEFDQDRRRYYDGERLIIKQKLAGSDGFWGHPGFTWLFWWL